MATDPVCGMEVTPDLAVATSEYQGETYYFCSMSCKQEFDNNPQAYSEPLQKAA